MNDRAKELKKIYQREWQRKNKDKVKQYRERYWSKKAKQEEERNG